MEYMEQDLTRYYLLNSHSRGEADEILLEAEVSAEVSDSTVDDAPYGETSDVELWKGKKETNNFMKQYYE